MSVLILGKGFIGQKLFRYLIEKGHRIHILDKATLDYTSLFSLENYLSDHVFKYVINASGYTGIPNVDAAELDKELCWKLNAEVPVTIASALEAAKSGYLLHISSGCIYNGYEKDYTEEDTPNFGLFNPESSFYSKSKHAAETMLQNFPAYSFRLRIPFEGTTHDRNYLSKLMKYDSLISTPNSITSVTDFCQFVHSFIVRRESGVHIPFGPFNVVNPGVATASDIVENLRFHGVANIKHHFIELEELQTVAKRSNVVLDTSKSREFGLELPPVGESLRDCIKSFAEEWRMNHCQE